MGEQVKCPTCGFVMCELSTYERKNGRIYAIPNGQFICYHCEKQKGKEPQNA